MSRLIIRSRREDITRFMNLVTDRIKKINEAEPKPVTGKYGVNVLADKLHPKTQTLVISDNRRLSEKTKILSLTPADGSLSFFRAGQSINIKNGSFSSPFPLLSAPGEKKYEIAVFTDANDNVSKHLFELPVGSVIEASGPEGLFYYSPLRDKKTVIAVCTSEGIAPIISMAKSEDFNLKIIYCDKSQKFVFKELLNGFTVEYTNEFSSEYIPSDCSVFISGPADFCENVSSRLKLEAGRARIHIALPAQTENLPDAEYKCTVIYRDKKFEFSCFGNETVLAAFERNSIPSPAKCKVGECGFCRCRLIEGKVNTVTTAGIDSRRKADKKYDFIHPCRAFAESDITLAL